MATLEDKILGEKLHNYCSSSEEGSDGESGDDDKLQKGPMESAPNLPDPNKWEGTSSNTGPKGVIEDWRKFKQIENEKREENQREMVELAKKLTMTVRTSLEEEREKAALDDPELAELLNDDFLLTYQKQRMKEMLEQTNHNKKFGQLIYLQDGDQYLNAVDKEDKSVSIIIHIYEESLEACRNMNHCLKHLSQVYEKVKFCAIMASRAGVSQSFQEDGIPALLVYKGGNLIGNFVSLSKDLGRDFQVEEVQSFLVEHGLLEDKSCKPVLIKSSTADSDSD